MNDSPAQTDRSSSAGSSDPARAGLKYFATVGVLLVIVIGLLAALWLRERHGRVSAQHEAAQWKQKFSRLEGVLGNLLVRPADSRPATQPADK